MQFAIYQHSFLTLNFKHLSHTAPIVEFISYPVLIGFMSAGVLNIVLSQAVAMVGIKGSSVNVIESIENIINGINQFKLWDMVLGITCISTLLLIWVSILSQYVFKQTI
jgi:MFS superfamily sulfate permease-like transporter